MTARSVLPTGLPPVMVDVLQVEQVLVNLLRNSIEAIGESGNPARSILIEAKLAGNEFVEVIVADSGPGFSPEHIENLPLASKKPDGLGIGLSLCRSIIEAHGGQLRWRHVHREDWSGSHCLSLKTMSDPIHLALIDDDEAVLDALRHYFSRRNVRTFCYHLATDFVAAIDRAEPFDCVVSDIRMPGMSGLELVNRLHELAIAWPIILITGHGDIDMAVAAIKNGVFDFIEKPFDEARLLASIRQAVENKRRGASEAAEVDDLAARFNALSDRQRQVMELVATGLSSKEIGLQLNISRKTVENHRAWVMERVGARNVAELVRMAIKSQKKD